ncbi:PREDICTED: probable transcription factor At4g01260 [Camelina sativa]|uniref:Probable transcription factor At4g01260 n=1 Tax=Camelina sativa TaxID=90675 RepID=A0ABM0WQ90_CAMSA|nr:PREDICTED: probable transcription factor At4g01260 [Camelina sativa]
MAPKQPEKIENPPVASSSEEESGSESGSSSSEESDSSSDDVVVSKHSGSKTTTTPTHVETLPESSKAKAKRPLEETEEGSKKKMKTSEDLKSDEKPKQNLFARIFSEDDDVFLLHRIIDFTAKTGNPTENMDAFYEYVKKSLSFDASKDQLVTKVRNLRRKFDEKILKSLEKGITEEEQIVFPKVFDQTCFDLSRKIWGTDGILPCKSKKVRQEQLEGRIKDEENEKPQRHVITPSLSSALEIFSLYKSVNPNSFLDEVAWIACWDKVKDGPKKLVLEEKMKKIKSVDEELCLMKIDVLADASKTMFKQDGGSTSGK